MKIQCPSCGQHYEVDNSYIGTEVQCTSCSQNFIVQANLPEQTNESMQQEESVPSCRPSMKALTCEMCGSTNIMKQDGVFVCQSCGTKYSVEEAKKMMIAGTVNVSGTVKVDMSEKLQKLYLIARRAKNENNSENAAKYYDLILQEDPQSWEASFYLVYYKAMQCKIAEIASAASSVEGCLKNVIDLVKAHISDENKQEEIFNEIADKSYSIANMLGNAADNHFKGIDSQFQDHYAQDYIYNMLSSAQICYTLGDLLAKNSSNKIHAVVLWKNAIQLHIQCIPYCADKKANKSKLETYASMIKIKDPNYVLPPIPSGCYIATAVYGSYNCPQVWTLRRFRDEFLASTLFGRFFIHTYYFVSPTLVRCFGKTQWFKKLWKNPLDRLVRRLKESGISDKPYNDKIW